MGRAIAVSDGHREAHRSVRLGHRRSWQDPAKSWLRFEPTERPASPGNFLKREQRVNVGLIPYRNLQAGRRPVTDVKRNIRCATQDRRFSLVERARHGFAVWSILSLGRQSNAPGILARVWSRFPSACRFAQVLRLGLTIIPANPFVLSYRLRRGPLMTSLRARWASSLRDSTSNEL